MHHEKHVTRLCLLGGWELSVGGVNMLVGHRQQRLLAALAVHGRRSRHFLGGLLWPDCTEAHAMGSLRASVFTITRRLPGVIAARGHELLLEDSVDVDLHRLLNFLARPTTSPIPDDRWCVDRSRVELLPGWYDDWVLAEQERLRGLYANALEQLAQAALDRRDVYRALTLAQTVQDLDPLRESAVRILVQGHLAIDNEAAALHAFRCFQATLAHELGTLPSARITGMVSALQRP
ncbi:BTAD domain-containing putative transcriptional regulator [Kocuria sp. CPCC 205258]|jgi:DNA-binding SARP family transcriptional activator|uniref:AfsR/SARP family transcriptional regulator n=1 Tax=Kocuria sp. CPCC 205258 TaxID=3073552 RepID=UPI0034D3C530